jgi:hypothetical protein
LSGTTRTNGRAIRSADRSSICSWANAFSEDPDDRVVADPLEVAGATAAGDLEHVLNELLRQRDRALLLRRVPVQPGGVRVGVVVDLV